MVFLLVFAVPGMATAEVVRIVGERVEVRREPSAAASVLGTVAKGTVFQVLGREGGWVHVAYPIGNGAFYNGYVPAVFCEDARGAAPSAARPSQSAPPASAGPPPVPSAPAPVAPAPRPEPARPAPAPQTYAPPAVAPTPVSPETAPVGPPASGQEREGFWIGLGLGYGSVKSCDDDFGCSDREGGLSGYLKLGGTLNPRLLLGVESTGWTKDEEGLRVTFGALSGTATYYPVASTPFFVKGGLGLSFVSAEFEGQSQTHSGWGFLAGVGYDLRVRRNLSITPCLNYAYGGLGEIEGVTGNHADLLQLAVGVTFH